MSVLSTVCLSVGLQIMKKDYPLTGNRKQLTQFSFEFDANETEITLMPEDSSSSRKDPEDWMQKSDEVHVAAFNQGEAYPCVDQAGLPAMISGAGCIVAGRI